MITLYHHTLSVPARFVRLLLHELDIPHEAVEERPWLRREEFLLLNPANTLPVLVEDGAPIVGAWSISEYLDETRGPGRGEHRLMPEAPRQRAEARRLVEWFIFKFDEEVTRYLVEEKYVKRESRANGSDTTPNSAVLRAARANIRVHLRYIDYLMHSRNWLSGERLTHADLAATAALSVADFLGEAPWSEAEEVKNWYAKMKSRPSVRPLLADHLRGMIPPPHYADLDF